MLIADDNVDAAESLAELLEELGAETRVAHDGEQALAAAEAFHPDVAFLDVGMPKLDEHLVKPAMPEAVEKLLVAGPRARRAGAGAGLRSAGAGVRHGAGRT